MQQIVSPKTVFGGVAQREFLDQTFPFGQGNGDGIEKRSLPDVFAVIGQGQRCLLRSHIRLTRRTGEKNVQLKSVGRFNAMQPGDGQRA